MILAAGFGTRLRPITFRLPKPMVPIANRPLIAYAVEQYLRAGIDEIVVNLHHLPEPIERYLSDAFDVRFHFSREPEILGTGGGVRKVRELLADEFFLVNADTIQFPDYAALHEARGDALAALTLRHPPAGDRFTAVHLDNGVITGFGSGRGEALMFSGSHCISNRIFDWLPEKDFSGIVDEGYIPAMNNGETVAGLLDDDPRWFDIGTPQRYMSASRAILDHTLRGAMDLPPETGIHGDSLVHEKARVTGSVQRSVVGRDSAIEGTLEDTSVWDGCRIGEGVVLRSCIVGHGVELTEPETFENAVIVRSDTGLDVVQM
ncbi:MAG: NTP transferase domain-containing protein [Acidobacteria bacterium]|nr:NTP transferase domain-containing protein [Acidobacteriota bacterium]